MPRCTFCGFNNDENVEKCIKCNALLEQRNAILQSKPTVPDDPKEDKGNTPVLEKKPPTPLIETPPPSVEKSDEGGRVTKINHQANRNPVPPPATATNPSKSVKNTCAQCGYFLVTQSGACPKCGSRTIPQSGEPSAPPKQQQAAPSTTQQPTPGQGQNFGKSTMKLGDFSMDDAPNAPAFVPSMQLQSTSGKVYESFTGDDISVNRNHIDSNNRSISGTEHLKFVFKEGQWFVIDKSTNKATFIQVTQPTPIKDGDVLIIGNLPVQFKSDTQT